MLTAVAKKQQNYSHHNALPIHFKLNYMFLNKK